MSDIKVIEINMSDLKESKAKMESLTDVEKLVAKEWIEISMEYLNDYESAKKFLTEKGCPNPDASLQTMQEIAKEVRTVLHPLAEQVRGGMK